MDSKILLEVVKHNWDKKVKRNYPHFVDVLGKGFDYLKNIKQYENRDLYTVEECEFLNDIDEFLEYNKNSPDTKSDKIYDVLDKHLENNCSDQLVADLLLLVE